MTCMYLADDGKLVRFDRKPYGQEKQLQNLLSTFPELLADGLPGPNNNGRSKWLRVRDEFPLSDGNGSSLSVDHLFLDQEGIPTLVEDKRSANSENRRQVVAQMLDYASLMVGCSVRDIQSQFRAYRPTEADTLLSEFLGEQDADNFWKTVQTNLEAGRVRLVFVADEIPATLRRLIEFLNERLDVEEVVGIEIQRLESGGREAFVPTVIGRTARAETRKSAETGQGVSRTVDDFFELVQKREKFTKNGISKGEYKTAMLANLERFRDWGRQNNLEFAVGTSSGDNPRFTLCRAGGQPLVGVHADGGLYVPSKRLKTDTAALQDFGKRLQSEIGIALPLNLNCELCKLFELSPERLDKLLTLLYEDA